MPLYIILTACVITFAAGTPVIESVPESTTEQIKTENLTGTAAFDTIRDGNIQDRKRPDIKMFYTIFGNELGKVDILRPHENYMYRRSLIPLWESDPSLIPSSGGECIQRLINKCAYDTIYNVPELPVKEMKTKFVEEIRSTDYKHVKSSTVYLENNSSIQQESHSVQFTESTTSTFEFSMTQTIGIKASTKVQVPLVAEAAVEISAGFSFGEKWTSSTVKTIVYPSQKVLAPPKSRIRLTFHVYMAHFTTKYLSTFVMDPEHDLIKKCIKNLDNVILRLNPEDGIENNAKAIFTENQQEVINLPTILVSEGLEVRVHISDAEPISATIQDTSIRRINVLDLDKTTNYFI